VEGSSLLAVEGLALLAALHSLQLLNYCWRLLVHMYVISELYTCEKQRYGSLNFRKESFLTKNRLRRRLFSGRHQNALTECGTLLSSNRIPMKRFKRSYIKNFLMLVILPSLNAYRLLHSINCIILHFGGLRIQMYFCNLFLNTKRNVIGCVKRSER